MIEELKYIFEKAWDRGDLAPYERCISIKKKLIYLGIPKCASSSIAGYFSTRKDFIPIDEDSLSTGVISIDLEQVNNFNIFKVNNFNIFTVIRDPKSRWISGLNEFVTVYGQKGIEQELSENNFWFDAHTLPQIHCLPSKMHSSLISNLILLRLDKNLNQKISSLLGEDVQLDHYNSTSTDQNKKNNLNFCKKMFETYCEKNLKYYQEYEFDYRLFNLSK